MSCDKSGAPASELFAGHQNAASSRALLSWAVVLPGCTMRPVQTDAQDLRPGAKRRGRRRA